MYFYSFACFLKCNCILHCLLDAVKEILNKF
uniref:Uncharacterized protein n=1 Tax=Anguilla anguilla TaxID=7936 RepID=A0A0E9UQ44_ANGAN